MQTEKKNINIVTVICIMMIVLISIILVIHSYRSKGMPEKSPQEQSKVDRSNLFARVYGENGRDDVKAIKLLAPDSIALAGTRKSLDNVHYSGMLTIVGSDGVLKYSRSISNVDAKIHAIAQSPDGGFLIAGSILSEKGGLDVLVAKLDAFLNPIWRRAFGSINDEEATAIAVAQDGKFIVAAYTKSFGAGMTDILLIKMNSLGNVEWARTFGGMKDDYVNSILSMENDNYIFAGATASSGAGNLDILVARVDVAGNLVWRRSLGGEMDDIAYTLARDIDGGFIAGGITSSFGRGGSDALVLKLSKEGGLLWRRTLGKEKDEEIFSMIRSFDNGYIAVGSTTSTDKGNSDILMLKVDNSGKMLWGVIFGEEGNDIARGIIEMSPQVLAIAAYTESFANPLLLFSIDYEGVYSRCKWLDNIRLSVSAPDIIMNAPEAIKAQSQVLKASAPDLQFAEQKLQEAKICNE